MVRRQCSFEIFEKGAVHSVLCNVKIGYLGSRKSYGSRLIRPLMVAKEIHTIRYEWSLILFNCAVVCIFVCVPIDFFFLLSFLQYSLPY